MTRACDLGPGDLAIFDETPDLCTDCRSESDFDNQLCAHSVCEQCECGDCIADADIAERDAEDDRRDRDAALLEAKGDEMREAYR